MPRGCHERSHDSPKGCDQTTGRTSTTDLAIAASDSAMNSDPLVLAVVAAGFRTLALWIGGLIRNVGRAINRPARIATA